jgi:drug/metabolite transporter (DMT)-like permease
LEHFSIENVKMLWSQPMRMTSEQVLNAPPPGIWLVIFLGAGPSALAYLSWAKALSLAPNTSSISNYMFLTPFLALLLEYVVTKDLPGVATFVGGGIIMASLVIFLWASRKA